MSPRNTRSQPGLYSLLLHILGLASFALSFQYLLSLSTIFSHGFGGHFQYFTNLGLLFSTTTFALGLIADIIGSSSVATLKKLLLSFATPNEVIITLSYWPLLFYYRTLILDARSVGQPPLLWDMGFHLFPAILLSIDSIFLAPPSGIGKLTALGVIGAIIAAYWVWLVVCFRENGYWIYPAFGKMDAVEKVGVFSVWVLMVWISWIGAEWANRWVNGIEQKEKSVGKRKMSRGFRDD